MRGDSYLDGDEPAAREERPAAAELVGQRVGFEVALVDMPARAVAEDSFLPLDRVDLVVERGVDDDQLVRDAARLAAKGVALVFLEVAVEEARQQPFEGVVRERKLECVPLDEPSLGNLRPGELEHRWTLVEPRDLAPEALGEKAGSTGDVERPRGRERPERVGQRLGLLEPAGPPAVREHPPPEPPVVPLRTPPPLVSLPPVPDYWRAFARPAP